VDRQALVAAARAATQRHKEGGKAFQKRARAFDAEVERDVKRRRGKAIAEGALVPVQTDGGSRASLDDFASVVAGIAGDIKAVRAYEKEQAHEAAAAVKAWRHSTGVRPRDKLILAAPALARDAASFTGEASVGGDSIVTWCYPCEEVIPRALGVLSKEDPGILEECRQHWSLTLHKVIRHDEQQAIEDPPQPKANEKWSCKAARFCLCSELGDEVWAMKVWLCASMKQAFPSKKKTSLLDSADVVMRITSEPNESDEEEDGEGEGVDDPTLAFLSYLPYELQPLQMLHETLRVAERVR